MTLSKQDHHEVSQRDTLPTNNASSLQDPWSRWPEFDEEQVSVAMEVLRSGKVNYWTGQEGRLFEREFASFVGCKHAVAVANGTVAIELALNSVGVEQGDEVIVPPRTFIATASAVVACGAKPVFADVDSNTQNIHAKSIQDQITPKTKAIIVVHLAGLPCDMDPILRLAKKNQLVVIEDCAQAHGASYKGHPVGSLGDVAAFSFCQDKIMTTAGEGGMVVTNSDEIWRKAWSFKDHGKSYEAVYERDHPPGFRWVHESFGTNFRMTEVQAAIGRVALRKLPNWVESRRRNARLMTEGLRNLPAIQVPVPPEDIYHSYYKFYAFVDNAMLKEEWSRDRIIQEIASQGIPCFSGSCSEIYLEKAFPVALRPEQRLPIAKALGEQSLMFLVDPTLSEKKIQAAAKTVHNVIASATSEALTVDPTGNVA